jgi:hypothetical protein
MPIRFVCHSCGRQLNAPDNLAGRKAKCPSCNTIVPIPAAMPVKVAPPAVKERTPPKRRQPEPEEQITHLEEVPDEPPQRITRKAKVPDEAEPVEEVVAAKPARKPKRKKRRRPRERAEQTIPTWLLWLISVGGFVLLAGIIALPAIYKGYGALVLVYSVIIAVMVPISTVILIISMYISSALGGGIDFGEARTTIPKAAGLLLVVNSISLLPFGRILALPIWWGGLMALFRLDWWETRMLVFVNWCLNFLAQMAVFAVLMGVMHGVSHLSSITPRLQQAPATAEEKAIEAIEELGGECSTDDEDDDSPVVSVTLADKPATDAILAQLKSFPKLRSLDLSRTQITDAGLVHLKGLKQLQTLTLTGTKVTNAGVADLQAALPRVRIVR